MNRKNLFITAAIITALTLACFHFLQAEGQALGTVFDINVATGEISIQNPKVGEQIRMGDKLYVRIDGKAVVMEATFPMMTLCKCKLLPAYRGQLGKVQKGMTAYSYVAGIEKEDTENLAGSRPGEMKKFGDIEMVFIPGGSFMMGRPEGDGGRNNKEPQHKVELSAFWMGRYEVTQKQYRAVTGTNPAEYTENPRNPVDNMNWYVCVEFCNKLSAKLGLKPYYSIDKRKKDLLNRGDTDNLKYTVTITGGNGFRLPTEAEWEYACRAGTTSNYNFGNSIDITMANFRGNRPYYELKPVPVGSYKPNAWGLYDMHGNVEEWCMDWQDYEYYMRSPVKDPVNLEGGSSRIFRGGSCTDSANGLNSAYRNQDWPHLSADSESENPSPRGFRVVRSLQ